MAIEKLKCNLQYVLPHHFLSRMIAKLAECRVPFIKNRLIKLFVSHYDIDLSAAASADLTRYLTFNDFFTRALKIGTRPIAAETNAVVSAADGTISQAGKIENGQLFQAKGQSFSLLELVGNDPQVAQAFFDGQFVTTYLAPHDYHRVHMPLDGKLLKTIYVPGKLFSVNNRSVANVANLFCRNERLVCVFNTEVGEVVLIMVGAMLVAGIETVWGGRVTPCHSKKLIVNEFKDRNISFKKGDEIGRFQFGSTVILLFRPITVSLLPLSPNQHIHMGQLIGHLKLEDK